jgi:subtilisin family serine protease
MAHRFLISVTAAAVSLTAAAGATTVRAERAPRDRDVIPNSYIVTLSGGDPAAVAVAHGRRHGAQVDFVYTEALRGYAAHMSAAQAADVAAEPGVASVVPDRRVSITAQTLPPGIDRVGADESSAASGDGRGAVDVDIAIIDTGIDAKHGDLNVAGGVNCVPGGRSFDDLNGHGTHVAGIAAARDNSRGVVGVAPGARLWAVRVLTAQGFGSTSSIICGIDWVTARADTIEVANMSLGGGAPEGSCTDGGEHQAICNSVAAGVTYTVAAGNDSSDAAFFAPASYDEVITVSAITDFDGQPGGAGAPSCPYGFDDTFAGFSNFGADVDLAAPGVCVLSTWRKGDYRSISGTSMASPHVAGAAALYASTHPGASPAEIQAALVAAGTFDWSGDPDGIQEPLLQVANL